MIVSINDFKIGREPTVRPVTNSQGQFTSSDVLQNNYFSLVVHLTLFCLRKSSGTRATKPQTGVN